MKTFGKVLRELRRHREVSQRELAEKVNVDFSYISKLENDRLPPPAADTILNICNVLNSPPDELLALSGKMPTALRKVFASSPAALAFVRTAKELRLTEQEWKDLVEQIKNLRE